MSGDQFLSNIFGFLGFRIEIKARAGAIEYVLQEGDLLWIKNAEAAYHSDDSHLPLFR